MGRILRAAALGAAIETAGVLLIHPFRLYEMLSHLLLSPFLVWMLFRTGGKQQVFKAGMNLYLSFFILGGTADWISERCGNSKLAGIVCTLTLTGIFYAVQQLSRRFAQEAQVYQVTLTLKQHEVHLNAYNDTGNTLREPFFQRPVHIVGEQAVEELLQAYGRPMQQIPYRTVAGTGLIRTMVLDSMAVQTPRGEIVIGEPVVGIAKEMRFPNHCEMLLNPQAVNEKT